MQFSWRKVLRGLTSWLAQTGSCIWPSKTQTPRWDWPTVEGLVEFPITDIPGLMEALEQEVQEHLDLINGSEERLFLYCPDCLSGRCNQGGIHSELHHREQLRTDLSFLTRLNEANTTKH